MKRLVWIRFLEVEQQHWPLKFRCNCIVASNCHSRRADFPPTISSIRGVLIFINLQPYFSTVCYFASSFLLRYPSWSSFFENTLAMRGNCVYTCSSSRRNFVENIARQNYGKFPLVPVETSWFLRKQSLLKISFGRREIEKWRKVAGSCDTVHDNLYYSFRIY